MPIIVELSDRPDVLEIVGSGVVTEQDYLEAGRRIEELERRLGPIPHSVSDWTDVERLELSSSAIHDSARAVRDEAHRFPGGQRKAIIAPSDEAYGIGRMWQSLVEGTPIDCRVFRTRLEAEAWMGLARGAEGASQARSGGETARI